MSDGTFSDSDKQTLACLIEGHFLSFRAGTGYRNSNAKGAIDHEVCRTTIYGEREARGLAVDIAILDG